MRPGRKSEEARCPDRLGQLLTPCASLHSQYLTVAELRQLEVSNYLLYVAIRLFIAAMLTNTPGLLEHPRQPKKTDRASIWLLPWLRAMLDSPLARQELLWQAQFGAQSAKPTHMGVCHLPQFRRILRQHFLPTDWNALKVLNWSHISRPMGHCSGQRVPISFKRSIRRDARSCLVRP